VKKRRSVESKKDKGFVNGEAKDRERKRWCFEVMRMQSTNNEITRDDEALFLETQMPPSLYKY
jgi:hypothetical protein